MHNSFLQKAATTKYQRWTSSMWRPKRPSASFLVSSYHVSLMAGRNDQSIYYTISHL